MAGTMKFIKEYLRLCHIVVRAPLAYIIMKAIIVQTYGDYPKYVTPANEMITRMIHLPPGKNRLQNEQNAQLVKESMVEYKIDNRSVYDILDQICKGTHLYPYVKQHKSKRGGRCELYAIHSRWLGPNHERYSIQI